MLWWWGIRTCTAVRNTLHVITGLVPVISINKCAALLIIGMAGTSPAMT
jgi:hypothetical protein